MSFPGGFVVPEGLPRRQAQVLACLIDEGRAMRVQEVAEALREVGITSKEHAFAVLKNLRKRGLVERVETLRAWVARRPTPPGEATGFAICDDCRRIWRFTLPRGALTRVADARGFTTRGLTLELHGSCVDCGGELPEGLGQGSDLEFVAGFDARPVAGFDDPEEDHSAL
jgi:Fur family zinc uptake transcriptional regulator